MTCQFLKPCTKEAKEALDNSVFVPVKCPKCGAVWREWKSVIEMLKKYQVQCPICKPLKGVRK